MTTVPATGWYVELDHPTSGHTFRPSPHGTPKWKPDLNGLPRIEFPVKKSDRWTDSSWDEAKMRAWYDGNRLPIEEFEKATQEPGRTVLVGIGGIELREPIRAEYARGTAIDDAAKTIVQNNTSYATDFDEPVTRLFENQTVQKMDTDAEFEQELLKSIADDVPLEVRNDNLEHLQAGYLGEGENNIFVGASEISDSAASQAKTAELVFDGGATIGDSVQLEATLDYQWNNGALWIRRRSTGTSPKYEFKADGTQLLTTSIGTSGSSYNWIGATLDPVEPLDAGDHDFTIEVLDDDGGATDDLLVDVIYAQDTDAISNANFDNSTDADNNLNGPELYPVATRREFVDAQVIFVLTNVDEVDLSINEVADGISNSPSNDQSIGVSTDNGSTWDTENNTETHSGVSIAGEALSARFRTTLSRYDDGRNATPTKGNSGHVIRDAVMQADQKDLPYVFDETFDRPAVELLAELGKRGDQVFEVTYKNGEITVSWASAGGRTNTDRPDLEDFEFSRSTENLYQKARIFGDSVFKYDGRFTSNHGTFVDLTEKDLVAGSETVTDPSFGGTQYLRNGDYEMDYQNGKIKVLSNGDMADNTEFSIDYDYKLRGEYDDGTNNPRTLTDRIPELETQRACDQAAYELVRGLNTATQPTRVVLTSVEPGYSLIEEIAFDALPTSTALEIKKVSPTPERTVVNLDARESAGEIVNKIRSRVSGLSRSI